MYLMIYIPKDIYYYDKIVLIERWLRVSLTLCEKFASYTLFQSQSITTLEVLSLDNKVPPQI